MNLSMLKKQEITEENNLEMQNNSENENEEQKFEKTPSNLVENENSASYREIQSENENLKSMLSKIKQEKMILEHKNAALEQKLSELVFFSHFSNKIEIKRNFV